MRRPLVALALAATLAVAGCAGPAGTATESPTPTPDATPSVTTPAATATPTATPTPTPEPGVTVEGGNLSVDEDAVFARVTTLTGREVVPPTVTVRSLPAGSPVGTTPVHRMLGLETATFPEDRSAGLTEYDGSVALDPGGDRTSTERTLAHEYVHVVQFRSGTVERPRSYDARRSHDFRLAWQAVVEGGAVYVTDAYVREHMPEARLQSTVFERTYEAPPTPESRLTLGPYYFGHRYVAAQVDGPSDLAAASEPFPNTTEQVIHDRRPAAEPPRDLSVDVEAGDRWSAPGRADRKGELFTRVLLRTGLDRERAARAAAGWGNDRWVLLRADGGGAYGLAWTLRWDSPTEADEFERAARRFVEQRRGNSSGSFRVERAAGDTVVLFVGHDEFVENATATADGSGVTVTVGEADGN